MKAKNRDALIGICAISAIVSMIILLQLFGEIDTSNRWRLTLLAPATGGIGDSSRVLLDGVHIGGIEHVETVATGQWGVRIVAAIDENARIPEGVEALTVMSLLTGSANLYLESPTTRTGANMPIDGTAELVGPIESTAIRDIALAIDERIGPALAAIDELGQAWAPVGDGVAMLLGQGEQTAGAGLGSVVQRADEVLAAAQSWLEDPDLRREASEFMHMALAGVDRAVTALESFDAMIQTLDTDSSTVAAELANAGRAFSEALHQASSIMTTMSEGQGTAGQLLTNPDLYNRFEETAKQLKRLAESMRLMVEQIREEGVGPLISP
jgi:ABC-type transporter Mla subunit MlaD